MGRLVPVLLLFAALAGCHDPLTEVVLVFESDLNIPVDTNAVQISFRPGPEPPQIGDFETQTSLSPLDGLRFPVAVGVTSAGNTPDFSVTVQFMPGFNEPGTTILVGRTISDIRFVDQQTMMLVVPFSRACACDGTSCPNDGNPDCESLRAPVLEPFDPSVAPPSSIGKTQ
jgi:hypothetical protein